MRSSRTLLISPPLRFDPADTAKPDSCFPSHTKLNLWDGGSITIGEVVSKRLSAKLVGIDQEGRPAPAVVTDWFRNGKKTDWLEIETDAPIDLRRGCVSKHGNVLIVTPNHQILVGEGYIPACAIRVGDVVWSAQFTPGEEVVHVIRSGLLGDGSVTGGIAANQTLRYQESHVESVEDYVEELKHWLGDCAIDHRPTVCPGFSGRPRVMHWASSRAYKLLSALRQEWYPNGVKEVPKDLSWVDDFSVAKWYMDDGSIHHTGLQRDRAKFATHGFVLEDVRRLAALLRERYGANAVVEEFRGYASLRLNAGPVGVDRLQAFWSRIAPHVVPCMRYKLPERFRGVEYERRTRGIEERVAAPHKVLRVGPLATRYARLPRGGPRRGWVGFDVQTATGNYSAKGVVVHNSLALPYLAGALRRAGFEADVLDAAVGTPNDRLEDTFYRPVPCPDSGLQQVGLSDERIVEEAASYDILGITNLFATQTSAALHTIRLLRSYYPKKWIIAGGVNARSMVERFIHAGVDCVATSEAEDTIVALARAWAAFESWRAIPGLYVAVRGAPHFTGIPPVPQDLDALPFPDWTAVPLERYWQIGRPHGGGFAPGSIVKYASMMTSRGCPFVCKYCHISRETAEDVSGSIGALRLKSIPRVEEEVARLRALGIEYLYIEDDSFLAKKARVLQILAMLERYRLRLLDTNGVNLCHLTRKEGGKFVLDTELLDALQAAGFERLSLPFEAGTQRMLDRWASKKWRLDHIDTEALVKACRDRGIYVAGNYMIGYPDETLPEMQETVNLAKRHMDAGLNVAAFFCVVPFPGTRLYDEALERGWLARDFNVDRLNWNRTAWVPGSTPVHPDVVETIRDTAWRCLNPTSTVQQKRAETAVGQAAA